MKAIFRLEKGDGVSGTTLFDDGTKVFWSEGRSEHTQILHPDGRLEYTSAYLPTHPDNPVIKALNEGDERGIPGRDMTLAEEFEHTLARNELLVKEGR